MQAYIKGYNHSIAYCLVGYLCAYYRYYHTIEFITAFLNNAANDEDIINGTKLAESYGIKMIPPKFGFSGRYYTYNKKANTIAKGLSSVKYIGLKLADEIYNMSNNVPYDSFVDVLLALEHHTSIDSRQLEILIHIDFFDQFGNQRELMNILFYWNLFKHGDAKQIRKQIIAGSYIDEIVRRHSNGKNKDGSESASYKIANCMAIIRECEQKVKSLGVKDIGILAKIRYYKEAYGYNGYVSGRAEDRPILYVKDVFPVKRKRDGKQFGYVVTTQSIGSGIETRWTVFNSDYKLDPINKDDLIKCLGWSRDRGKYFTLYKYKKIINDDDLMDDLEDEQWST